MKRNQRTGFTLIELLVVIAIVAILASILFPVFGRARENARRSACMSNMKQLGLGFLQYAQDNDEFFPFSWKSGMAYSSGAMGWGGRIYSYVRNTDVYRCPSDGKQVLGKVSYSSNDNIGGYSTYHVGTYGIYKPIHTAQFKATEKTVLLLETSKVNFDVSTNSDEHQTASTDGYNSRGGQGAMRFATGPIGGCQDWYAAEMTPAEVMPPARHLGGANYLAVDGHVKWLRPENVSRGENVSGSSTMADGGCSTWEKPAGTANMGKFALTFSIY